MIPADKGAIRFDAGAGGALTATFDVPSFVVASTDLETIARWIGFGSVIEHGDRLGNFEVRIARVEDQLRWHVRDKVMRFSTALILSVDLDTFPYMDTRYVGVAITFKSSETENGTIAYRMFTGSFMQIDWIRRAAMCVGELADAPPLTERHYS